MLERMRAHLRRGPRNLLIFLSFSALPGILSAVGTAVMVCEWRQINPEVCSASRFLRWFEFPPSWAILLAAVFLISYCLWYTSDAIDQAASKLEILTREKISELSHYSQNIRFAEDRINERFVRLEGECEKVLTTHAALMGDVDRQMSSLRNYVMDVVSYKGLPK